MYLEDRASSDGSKVIDRSEVIRKGIIDVDHSKELPTVLSLCTGYGGIERGLELAGFEHRVITHAEIEAYAIANLVAKMEEGDLVPAPIWTDIKTLPAHCFRDRVDVLTGGYPCQPFSAAGQRKGTEDPRHLWPHIKRHIETIRPVRCFFENVEGHISLGLRQVIEDLEGLGYATTWGIFSAVEVGAAHQRKRVFILADSNGDNLRQQPGRGRRQDRQGEAFTGVNGEAKPMANANDAGQQPSGRQGQARDNTGRGSEDLADAHKSRLQGRIQGGIACQEERQVQSHGPTAQRSARWEGNRDGYWTTEPNVGRVVNGAPHRVDRLRLLGNGVVPQTAAKAWQVLGERI